MNLRILPQLLDGVAPVDDERDPGATVPASGLPFTTVEPWQVDIGQRLAGVPGLPVVDQVLFDGGESPGAWLLIDADGVIVARVAVGGTIEVCAAQDVEGCGNGNDRGLVTRAVSPSTTDACPAYGIERPRRLIAVEPL